MFIYSFISGVCAFANAELSLFGVRPLKTSRSTISGVLTFIFITPISMVKILKNGN